MSRERPVARPAPHPPSVESVMAAARPALGSREHAAVLAQARAVVDRERELIRAGRAPRDADALAADLIARIDAFRVPSLDPADGPRAAGLPPSLGPSSGRRGSGTRAGRPPAGQASSLVSVVNATGVILHTNLGRAPWAEAAIQAAARAARDPSFLEMDAATGKRGRRSRIVEDHLVALTGAEDALATTNNAAAVAVAVGLAGRRGVAVSRGELVEIGGGVRIPDIVRRAGARLVEVGTTNRTRASDFAEPLASGRVAVILRVHPSNFAMTGFVESPDPAELAELAHAHGAIVIDDLGAGALLDTAAFGLAHEPTPAEALAAGADLVTFSGDKLLGGPQAGLVVGRADLVARVRRDPLARATRPDKVIVAALAATLGLYRAGLAAREIPVWRAIAIPADVLRARAEAMAGAVGSGAASGVAAGVGRGGVPAARSRRAVPAAGGDGRRVRACPTLATVGGGSLPGETLPSWGVAVDAPGRAADALLAALRAGDPPVIGRADDGRVVLDLRTVPEGADGVVAGALRRAMAVA